MSLATMTYKLAMAIAHDAGDASMKAGGRKRWNEQDWHAAFEAFDRLWPQGKSEEVKA